MALSINDLDALLQYDPASHSVSGFPKPRTDTLGGAGLGEAANAADRIPSVGAAPAQQTASNPAIPKLESVPPPNITPAPAYTPGSTISSATGETANVKPKLSGWDKLKGGLAKAANIAGDVLAPEVMPLIPGTDLNKVWQQNREAKLAGENARTGLTTAQTGEAEANTWKALHPTTATDFEAWEKQNPNAPVSDWIKLENAGKPETEFTEWQKQNPNAPVGDYFKAQNASKAPTPEQDKQRIATLEQNLANGTLTDADRQWLAGQQRTAKMSGIGPEIVSQVGEAPVPADYPKGKNDPAYREADRKWGEQAEALKNQEAGAAGAARGAGYNATRPVQVLVPQPDGTMASVYMTAGQAEAAGFSTSAGGTKALSQTAQFNDINNAIDKVDEALNKAGKSTWNADQVAKLSLAMRETDPTLMRDEIANLAASGLTPEQQDLVTWLQQLNERALSLRNIAGMGQGSDTVRGAIQKALPSITSGSPEMAHKQLAALKNMVENLRQGILTVPGNQPGTTGGGTAIPSFADWKKAQSK